MFSVNQSGSFRKTESFLQTMKRHDLSTILEAMGRAGVTALASATPVDSGLTADSWDFIVERKRGSTSITWTNSHINEGAPIAIMLQYGHGTGTGGYVSGQDYINPAIQPIFDLIADKVWDEVKKA